MKKLFLLLCLTFFTVSALSQSSLIPYNRDYYHIIDRFVAKFPEQAKEFQTTFKPVSRENLAVFLNSIKEEYPNFSEQDKFNFEFLMNDNWEFTDSEYIENDKNWWDVFYTKKSDLLYYQGGNSTIHINPVFDFTGGKDSETDGVIYTNTRGAEVQGSIDGKIGFYTFISTTQAQFPTYVNNYISGPQMAFPNEGIWKQFKDDGYDFFHARGYFTFGLTKSIKVQAGYDKNFIGNGHRSMILSDFSSPYLFLKIDTQVGPFQYTNMFSELTADIAFTGRGFPGDGDYPKKFWAFHRLGLNITPKFSIGLFESVMSENATLAYFNPIIFYRAVELQEGSPDNVLLGLDFNWKVKKGISVYGQALLDEFVLGDLRAGEGSWRNRYGIQLGAKSIDAFGVSNLDLQAELNFARPYLYQSEFDNSYSNYRNPLAHPIGANFQELVLVGRYQPLERLSVVGKIIYSDLGEDLGDGVNYGGNVLADTDDRASTSGNKIGQGANAKNMYIELRGSYTLMHNVFFDLGLLQRNFNSELAARDLNSTTISASLRWNLAKRQHEF
ncbi:hypothetical protein OB69_09540 [Roseivirga seohaensis subsp. aquiponti]|uniref:Gliding motility protein RemB n=1 Tax=Roseivirga seohaensis subsp. aquiponti TaxID=1566026 RepID=A0A0L8AKV2_9BACT|nr:hypothetical protein [Roseivirga seohaensis]KOF03048.1 hypothetical protein OB69_09540 [Roseivirga seohaensis subsp. aquiponti]